MLKIRIFIQDKYVISDDFSPDMFLVYLGLRKIIKQGTNEYFVSLGLLSHELTNNQIASQSITTSILSGINGLIDKKIVVSINDNKRRTNDWVLDISKLVIDNQKDKKKKEFYSSVSFKYITKILNSRNKDKLQLLRFYCYLITTISKTGDKAGVGFTSYQNMASSIGICRQTISKYMNKLEENKIIYIYRSADSIIDSDGIREIPNTYGDIANEKKIVLVGKSHVENYGENAKKVKSSRSSKTRSASVKYSILKKEIEDTGEVRYNYNELKEIYEVLVEYNEKYRHEESRLKDLSIFSIYDFYEE